jgi:hypothetical protein
MMPATRKPTEREKQKFLEYVEKKRLEANQSQMLQNKSSNGALNPKQPSSNLFIILIDDFFEKIDALEQFKAYDQQKKDNFKGNIADEILGKTSFRLLEDVKSVDQELTDDMSLISGLLDGNADLEEFFYKLDLLISQVPVLSQRYLAHLCMVYLGLCKEFNLKPNPLVLPYIKE